MTHKHVCIAVTAALMLSGCGKDPYALIGVRGKVTTCEGKPAEGGQVTFYPIEDPDATGRPEGNPGREAHGIVEADGTFLLVTAGIPPTEGVVTGRHRVEFMMPRTRKPVLSAEDRSLMDDETIKLAEADLEKLKVYAPIPCSSMITPQEVVVVADGENFFEFTLPGR